MLGVSGGDVWWVAKNTDLELRRDGGARKSSESDWMIAGSSSDEMRSLGG